MSPTLYALLMTLGAGLATPLGGALALLTKRTNNRLLSLGMGLSAGVLIYLALQGLLTESMGELSELLGQRGQLFGLVAFATGILLMVLMDLLIPDGHHAPEEETRQQGKQGSLLSARDRRALITTGITTAVIISIHNIPEGMMLYLTAVRSPLEAIPVMIAVAIHNLPIGLSIALPLYYAGGSRLLTIGICLASGLMELIGALLGELLTAPLDAPVPVALLLALIAGIMIYVSFDELVPAAINRSRLHNGLVGILVGMIAMGLTMVLV